jgi:hypothetical protein
VTGISAATTTNNVAITVTMRLHGKIMDLLAMDDCDEDAMAFRWI